jgi:hypothetical protein
LIELDFAYW